MKKDQIKKIIESCHLNFLIGSGASKPFLGTLGDIEMLLTDLASHPDSDEKAIIDASIKKHYFDVAIKGNLQISKGVAPDLVITKKAYSDFIYSINTILSKRKSNLVSKQVNIFTTNMDLFLENTIEELSLNYNDGFSGRINPIFGTENFHNSIRKTSTHYEYQSEVPLFNLFKIHGSLNWKQKKSIIEYDTGLEILNEIEDLKAKSKDFLEIEYKDKTTKKWKYYSIDELFENLKKKKLSIKDIHEDFLESYNKLVMINPTKEKFATTTRNLTFYELLRMYSNHLERENSVLFVFGFSFADEHIKEITKRVASANPTLLIVVFAFDKAAKESIESELPFRSNIKIIGDDTDNIKYHLQYITDNYFQSLATDLLNGKKNNK